MGSSARTNRAGKNPQLQGVKQAKEVMQRLRSRRGALSELAVELGLSAQAVHQWEVIPIQRVVEVERILGIPRQQLRPDFFAA